MKLEKTVTKVNGGLVEHFFYSLIKYILSVAIGFIIAKANIGMSFSPFALSLLAVIPFTMFNPIFLYLGCSFGYLTNQFSASNFRYIIALTLMLLLIIISGKMYTKQKFFTPALPAAICFITGFVFLFITEYSIFSLILLICESILCGCATFFFSYLIKSFKRHTQFQIKDIIAFSITSLILLICLDSFKVYGFSLSRILSILIVFLSAKYFKKMYAAIIGLCLGALAAALNPQLSYLFLAFAVASLLGSTFSSFSSLYGNFAFVLMYCSTLLFNRAFPHDLYLFIEPLLAVLLYVIIPKRTFGDIIDRYVPIQTEKETIEIGKQTNITELCHEYTAVSKQITDLIDQENKEPTFLPKLESGIKKHLFLKGYSNINVICAHDNCDKSICDISFNANQKPVNKKEIIKIVNHYFDKKLNINKFSRKNEQYIIRLSQIENYRIECSAIFKSKQGESVCGDNVTAFKTSFSKYILLLSDGMGSGKEAFTQSSTCVSLIKKLLKANMNPRNAVLLLNSMVSFKNSDNTFATVDMCQINLKSASATFLKAGAYESYIVRNNQIMTIKAAGMPIGLVDKADFKITNIKLEPNDLIVLISDGIGYDSNLIKDELLSNCDMKLDILARHIMDNAVSFTPAKYDDDMTVLTARIFKNE